MRYETFCNTFVPSSDVIYIFVNNFFTVTSNDNIVIRKSSKLLTLSDNQISANQKISFSQLETEVNNENEFNAFSNSNSCQKRQSFLLHRNKYDFDKMTYQQITYIRFPITVITGAYKEIGCTGTLSYYNRTESSQNKIIIQGQKTFFFRKTQKHVKLPMTQSQTEKIIYVKMVTLSKFFQIFIIISVIKGMKYFIIIVQILQRL